MSFKYFSHAAQSYLLPLMLYCFNIHFVHTEIKVIFHTSEHCLYNYSIKPLICTAEKIKPEPVLFQDNNGTIELDEFLAMMAMRMQTSEKIKEVFNVFDQDCDGSEIFHF